MKNVSYIILVALMFFISCKEKEEISPLVKNDKETITLGHGSGLCLSDTSSFHLMAGQNTIIGELEVSNDDRNLYVTYRVSSDWVITESHLYVGSLDEMPTNPALTPLPGKFPYNVEHGELSFLTYTVPLNSLNSDLDCFVIAAHSSVRRVDGTGDNAEETAWSEGVEFPNANRWGSYSDYCKQKCETEDENDDSDKDEDDIIEG